MSWRSYHERMAGRYERLPGDRCMYCGEAAIQMDHFLPLSIAAWTSEQALSRLKWLIPCCRECNSIAAAKVFLSFGRKRRFIQGRIAERYSRILSMPEWSDDELSSLGPQLRERIEWYARQKDRILSRVNWRNVRNAANVLSSIRSGRGSVRRDVNRSTTLA